MIQRAVEVLHVFINVYHKSIILAHVVGVKGTSVFVSGDLIVFVAWQENEFVYFVIECICRSVFVFVFDALNDFCHSAIQLHWRLFKG